MIYLAVSPFCPYCYANDRILEQEIPTLDDNDITIIPHLLTPDLVDYDEILYNSAISAYKKHALPYLEKKNLFNSKPYKYENVLTSKLVFLSYYYLREFNLGLQFYHEVTRRFWESDFNFGILENLALIVKDFGLNVDDYKIHYDDLAYQEQYDKYLQMHDDYDVDTVPTYIFEDEMIAGAGSAIKKVKEITKK
ncbi:DsbA family protein [Mycoplasma sp. P36-A1]|uniref:DsbA family protein n=1 Tax=Mycoplasma sp. P36-A1 TaxID=3252900 RepID=UPI003C2CED4C